MAKKGCIILNTFLRPDKSVYQAERLRSEFLGRGVETEIVSGIPLRAGVENGNPRSFVDCDFCIYLDKDKYFAEILEKLGVRLFNSAKSIELCNDKAETYIMLSGAGFNIPKTVFSPLTYMKSDRFSDKDNEAIANYLSFPIIVKEVYGSMGFGVYMANDLNEFSSLREELKLKPHLYQEYLPYRKGTDVRVILVGGKVVTAMERVNENDFRSNVAQGGEGRKISLSEEFKTTAERCAKILGLDYCGVDLLYGKHGEPFVCEVNSNAFFDGIEKVTGVDVAKAYVNHVIGELEK